MIYLLAVSFGNYVFVFDGIFKHISGSSEFESIDFVVQFGWELYYVIATLLLIYIASRLSNEVNDIILVSF